MELPEDSMVYLRARHVAGEGRALTTLGGKSGPMDKLDSYLSVTEDCMEAVHKMSTRQFNSEQCGYLLDKLTLVVENARSFLEVIKIIFSISSSSMPDIAKLVEIFKFLLALAKQIATFVQGCCKDAWIQAAMTLTNVSEYVSSLGFKLELCRAAFNVEFAESKRLTLVEVGNIHKVEVEIVEKMASVDVDSLLRKVTRELNSLRGENRDLAAYLLQRLLRDEPNSSSDDEGFLDKLFNWLIPGDQLGRGTSATVHRAMWLGTPVAKKTFDGAENPDFLKEVKILSKLCHSNITSMFCCAKNKRKCSIIMELMDGDLHTLMERRLEENLPSGSGPECPPFPIMEAVDIMLQVGEGVNYLHRRGIVHRDLKSKNILVKGVESSGSGLKAGYVHVKVADFGISKEHMRSTTYSNQTCNTGTARWMAPEVIKSVGGSQGSSVGNDMNPKHPFKCDTYSFAMVCYEILSGYMPFPNCHNANDIKEMVLKGERPELPKECPSSLKVLIEKCWDQDPRKRPDFDDICLDLKYLKYCLMRDFDISPSFETAQMQMKLQMRLQENLEYESSLGLRRSLGEDVRKIIQEQRTMKPDAFVGPESPPSRFWQVALAAACEPAHSRDIPAQSSQYESSLGLRRRLGEDVRKIIQEQRTMKPDAFVGPESPPSMFWQVALAAACEPAHSRDIPAQSSQVPEPSAKKARLEPYENVYAEDHQQVHDPILHQTFRHYVMGGPHSVDFRESYRGQALNLSSSSRHYSSTTSANQPHNMELSYEQIFDQPGEYQSPSHDSPLQPSCLDHLATQYDFPDRVYIPFGGLPLARLYGELDRNYRLLTTDDVNDSPILFTG